MRRTLFAVLFGIVTVASASSALAQSSPQPGSPAPPAQKLVVEQIQNGWLFSPDVRATDVNGRTGALPVAISGASRIGRGSSVSAATC